MKFICAIHLNDRCLFRLIDKCPTANFLQGLFASPLPTPAGGNREDALRNMVAELEIRLANETRAQAALKQQLTCPHDRDAVSAYYRQFSINSSIALIIGLLNNIQPLSKL